MYHLDSIFIEKFPKISLNRRQRVRPFRLFVLHLYQLFFLLNSTISSILMCKRVNRSHEFIISVFFPRVSELYVDIPESGTAERIPVHLDVSVLEIACQCK